MKTRMLGRTGVAVSRVVLGCGTFGGVGSPRHLIGRGLNREASLASMDEAAALGINLFDTAHSYADGESERYIGEWLRWQTAETRAAIRIATKVGNIVTDSGVSVDLSPLTAAMEASSRLGLPRYEWVQNEYNLLQRIDDQELLGLCDVYGIGYTPFSPVAGGLLSGKYMPNESPPPDSRLSLRPEGHLPSRSLFEGVAQLEREAERRGCDTGALALAWVIGHPQVTAAICGPSRRAEHLGLARQALAIELDESARTKIASWFESHR
jgi:1-deoxyxylulose-5-phosphate synthase